MGVGEMRQMHETSGDIFAKVQKVFFHTPVHDRDSGWADTGTSSGTTATGRALDHSDRYQKLKFRPIPRWRVGGWR